MECEYGKKVVFVMNIQKFKWKLRNFYRDRGGYPQNKQISVLFAWNKYSRNVMDVM